MKRCIAEHMVPDVSRRAVYWFSRVKSQRRSSCTAAYVHTELWHPQINCFKVYFTTL